MLEDEAAHAEATHEKMKDPLTVRPRPETRDFRPQTPDPAPYPYTLKSKPWSLSPKHNPEHTPLH